MKQQVWVEWDEDKQSFALSTGGATGLMDPNWPTRHVFDKGERETEDEFALRIGQVMLETAKGQD